MCGSNGVVIDGPEVNHVWWTDGYGDYIKHFLEGLGAVPQWAPPTQSHLLRSTSIVRSIQYSATEIDYTVADTASQETFRLAFTPESISVDGTLLPNLPSLTQEGWTYDSTTGALRLRHDSGTVIRVSGSSLPGNLAPTVTLDTPAAGTYTTTSLVLSATAGDADGVVDHVDFVANGLTIGTATSSPYQVTWGGLAPGNYVLAAAAVDNVGARTVSTSVAVSVSSPGLPSPPTGLAASVAGGTMNLVWTPPAGSAPARYALYRSTTTGFAPGASNLIAQPTGATYADVGLGPGTYFYRVAAVDASGAQSQPSNEASATIAGGLSVDKIVYSDGSSTRTSPGITTSFASELLLAFAASDGPTSGQSLTISGAGLTWTLVRRVTTQPGTAEIWQATASTLLSNATITSTQSRTGYHQSLTVVTFAGANGVGVSVGNSGSSAPTVSLTSSRAGSMTYGVGNDWNTAATHTVGSGQILVHQWVDTAVGDTFWVQARTTPVGAAGTTVQLSDTAPTSGRWNFAAVEVLPVVMTMAAVPNVVGLSQSAAQTQITSAGLALGTVTQQASATVPVGTVISETPTAGTQVSGGTAVALVVSSGPQQVAVPNVVGLTQGAAQTQITSAGLAVGTVTQQASATVPMGTVISQNPAAGAQAASGSSVALVVSSGVTVPNVVGQSQAAAQNALVSAGLSVGTVTMQASSTFAAGNVISQTPAGGTQVAGGSAVALLVSSGPPQVAVPNLVGLTQVAAQTQITGVGLAVGTVTQQASATVPVGAVISQNPVAGTQVAPGGLVDLVVSTGSQGSVPTVDVTVFSDGSGTRTTAAFSTTAPNELLLAFVASDGSASGTQSATVSGVGLTWRLVRRINAQHGTSEIWQATALTLLSNVTVTSTQVQSGYRQSLTVVAFKGTSGVGASAGSSATGGTPLGQLTTTRSNSLIYGVGNDWDRAMSRTTGSGQALIHQVIENTVGDTFWVQARTTPTASAGTTTQISDTAPTGDRWNLVAVEIVP